jgi:hypothetical protein
MSSDIFFLILVVIILCGVAYFWTVNKLMKRTIQDVKAENVSDHQEFEYNIKLAEGKVARLTGRVEILERKQ